MNFIGVYFQAREEYCMFTPNLKTDIEYKKMIVLRQKNYASGWAQNAWNNAKNIGKAVWEQEKQEWKEHPWKKGLGLAGEVALTALTFGAGGAAIGAAKAARYGAKGVKAYKTVRRGAGVAKNTANIARNVAGATKAVGKATVNTVRTAALNPGTTARNVGKWAWNTTRQAMTGRNVAGMYGLGLVGAGIERGVDQWSNNQLSGTDSTTQPAQSNVQQNVQTASMIPTQSIPWRPLRTAQQNTTTAVPNTANKTQVIQNNNVSTVGNQGVSQQGNNTTQTILNNPSSGQQVSTVATNQTNDSYQNAAKEIWSGKWGNGHDVREAKAKELGLDYNRLRQTVNNYKR